VHAAAKLREKLALGLQVRGWNVFVRWTSVLLANECIIHASHKLPELCSVLALQPHARGMHALTPNKPLSLPPCCPSSPQQAREHMVNCNMRLVVSIAKKYHGRGLSLQVSTLGQSAAVRAQPPMLLIQVVPCSLPCAICICLLACSASACWHAAC